jgi:hypothetical protein
MLLLLLLLHGTFIINTIVELIFIIVALHMFLAVVLTMLDDVPAANYKRINEMKRANTLQKKFLC